MNLDWESKGELFVAWWTRETLAHLGRGATYRWACDWGLDLTIKAITQVIHEYETCCDQVSHTTEVSLEQRVVAGMSIWWGLTNWLYWTTAKNLQEICKHHGISEYWVVRNIPCRPCYCLKHHREPWKVSSTATQCPRKNWVRQCDSFPK